MPLDQLIADLRAIFRDEAPTRLHTQALTDNDHPDEGGIGLPFTARFHRYLGHWSHWGQSRLGMLSVMEVSEWCHARHTSHAIPGSSRSLCAQLVYEACYLGQEVSDLAWLHALPSEQVERMLTGALNHAAEWRERQESRPTEARHDGPDPLPYERIKTERMPDGRLVVVRPVTA